MSEEIYELYKKINDLMKASNSFDVKLFEEILGDVEQELNNELDRTDEEKMEDILAENTKTAILKALDGKTDLDKISIVEQIITQAGGEYRALKTKYMNDAITFLIDNIKKNITTDKEDDDREKQ